MKKIKQYIGEVILLFGLGITSYNIFNFTNSSAGLLLDPFMGENIYYYEDTTLLLIASGVVLTVLGILIIKNRK